MSDDGRIIDAQRAADHLGLALRRLRDLDALDVQSAGAATEARDLRRAMPALESAAFDATAAMTDNDTEGRSPR